MLIHGLTETKTEDTDEMVLDVINNKLNIEMSQIGIDRSHRLGKWKGPGQKPRAIIVNLHDTKIIMSLQIKSSNKNEGIKAVLFFHEKISHTLKAQNANKRLSLRCSLCAYEA